MKIAYLTLLALLGGCDDSPECLMAVEDSLTFIFKPPLSTPGTWELDLTDGYDAHCEVELSVPDSAEGIEYTACGETNRVFLDIWEDGTAITEMIVTDSPDTVTLLASFDETLVWEETYTPDYTVTHDCREHRDATVYVQVPEP